MCTRYPFKVDLDGFVRFEDLRDCCGSTIYYKVKGLVEKKLGRKFTDDEFDKLLIDKRSLYMMLRIIGLDDFRAKEIVEMASMTMTMKIVHDIVVEAREETENNN